MTRHIRYGFIYPIGSRYLLRMVLELKVLPENGRGGSKGILRMVLDPWVRHSVGPWTGEPPASASNT